ncbi:MAG: type I restriction enzyme HsdR N-terminal domain-containing protein [Paludibacteraceae bacterium]|nr:type I restriction enzyme HsdR N-terminal domain-containing protein [Paludibacteraceae bacterium]
MENKQQIFDRFRNKFVALTPEEGVRQGFCKYLMEQKGYPQLSISTETCLKLNGTERRCDAVVQKNGKIIILLEFKAPSVPINEEVLKQAVSYNTKLQAPFIILSNSKTTYCIKFDFTAGTHQFLNEVPNFNELIENSLFISHP